MNIKTAFLIISTLCGISHISAQNQSARVYIQSQTNLASLNAKLKQAQKNIVKLSTSDVPKVIHVDGKIGVLSGFDLNGEPEYDFDDNVNAARTSKFDRLNEGGYKFSSLEGKDIVIGHWEASGIPLKNHTELLGQVTLREDFATSDHASHTACTMVGLGSNLKAKGMAPKAKIDAFSSVNDYPEMIDFALQGGILSNHSYARGRASDFTYLLGAYDKLAAEWDGIAYDAPYYLIVKSAGNNLNESPNISKNGYDLIFRNAGSKNILTVGSVLDVVNANQPQNITLSAFSSTGPTDDWRIKPDIVTNGQSLFSAGHKSTTAYFEGSGTSMAAAVASGGCALLQENHFRIHKKYMKSATVKAVIIHTADEAGLYPGPDFRFGWGLFNGLRAVELLNNTNSRSYINEATLEDSELYTVEFYSDGMTNVSATIVWNDVPGPETIGFDTRSKILVNDLDMVISSDTDEYYPWKFEPNTDYNNFNVQASKGDNSRDNVEKIECGILPKGNYTIKISHKGTLVTGSQDFSLAFSGAIIYPQSEEITIYPNPINKDEFNVYVPGTIFIPSSDIYIHNIHGQLVSHTIATNRITQIPCDTFSPGLYVVTVKNNVSQTSKLVMRNISLH